jgi:protein-S-isoprenylcysteine O-methyltransferase Ste14
MITNTEILAAAIATSDFILFVWALRGHFVSTSVPPGMWLVSVLSACAFITFLACLASTDLSWPWFGVGALVHLLALALFVAAFRSTRQKRVTLAFDRDTPTFLVRDGVYRRLRHPFYASYILFWVGCCIQVRTPAMFAVSTTLAALYLGAAIAEERKFAASSLAAAYRDYRKQTGLLWPKLRHPGSKP